MKLFYTKRSPYARKVRVIALEKNIPLELIEEDLMNKSPQLIATNPLGKVPALILDNGRVYVDSPVICEYLDSLNDQPILIPRSGEQRFKELHLAAIADGLMDSTVGLYMEKAVRHPEDFNVKFVQNQEMVIKNTLKFFDKHVHCLKELNIASIAVACALGYLFLRLGHLFVAEDLLELDAWYKEFSKRPSLGQTIPVI